MTDHVKLLLVDDHKLIRQGIKLMLSQQSIYNFKFTEVSSGEELMQLLSNESFDFMILDITLKKMSGIDVLKQMKRNKIKIPVLVQSMHSEVDIIRQAFEHGANGYMLKSSEKDEIITAIQQIFAGIRYMSPEISLIFSNDIANNLNTRKKTDLTVRQIEIMKSLAKGKTYEELAEIYSLSRRSIEGHRNRILKKLNLKTTAELIRYVFEQKL
ncbi:MAG: response regulator [Crocinitomicaceae bacterium]|jgi:two-component system invasion response regulator UvrY